MITNERCLSRLLRRPDWQQRPLEFRDLQYAAGAAMCQVHFYQMCARYSPDRVYQLLQLNPATA